MNRQLEKFDRRNGPLQIVHDFQFVALNVHDNYTSLDGMPFAEKLAACKARVDALADRYYGGIVLNVDFKNYLCDRASFALLAQLIPYIRQKGLRVWLYDEQYYPSGSAGGLTLQGHPEYEGTGLTCITVDHCAADTPFSNALRIHSPHGYSGLQYAVAVPLVDGQPDFDAPLVLSSQKDLAGSLCWDAPAGQWRVFAFFLRVMYEHTYLPQSLRASRRYLDMMNSRATEHFIDPTFRQGYQQHLGVPLGELVEAVFTDEPSLLLYQKYRGDGQRTTFASVSVYDKPDTQVPFLPYIPWNDQLTDRFYQVYGYALIPMLPALFTQTPHSDRVRVDFYRLSSSLTKEGFLEPMQAYLHTQSVALSGHYLLEECPSCQPHLYGDILAHLGAMDIPGCDRLYSAPEQLRYSLDCKVASSAAHLYGRSHAMIEASNMIDADQTMTLQRLTAAIAIMAAHGIDTVTSYYGENLLPPEEMARFGAFTARLGSVFEGGAYQIDTLLFYPFDEVCYMAGPEREADSPEYDRIGLQKTCAALLAKQICFDLINIDMAERCTFEAAGLRTAYGQAIRQLVLPELDFVTPRTNAFLCSAAAAGADIYAAGAPRTIDGLTAPVHFLAQEFCTSSDLTLEHSDAHILLMHRAFPHCDLYLLVNSGQQDKTHTVSIPGAAGGCLTQLDPLENTLSTLKVSSVNGALQAAVYLPALSCRVLCLEK